MSYLTVYSQTLFWKVLAGKASPDYILLSSVYPMCCKEQLLDPFRPGSSGTHTSHTSGSYTGAIGLALTQSPGHWFRLRLKEKKVCFFFPGPNVSPNARTELWWVVPSPSLSSSSSYMAISSSSSTPSSSSSKVKDRLEIFRLASFLRSFSRSFSNFLPRHGWPSYPMFLL